MIHGQMIAFFLTWKSAAPNFNSKNDINSDGIDVTCFLVMLVVGEAAIKMRLIFFRKDLKHLI